MLAANPMDQTAVSIVSIVFGSVAFIVFCILWYRYEVRKRHLKHAEQMKALEVGQPLPGADIARATAAGFIGTLVPLTTIAAALMLTVLVFNQGEDASYRRLLTPIWGVCGGVSLVVALASLRSLRHQGSVARNDLKR
jgi:hypothetical protein